MLSAKDLAEHILAHEIIGIEATSSSGVDCEVPTADEVTWDGAYSTVGAALDALFYVFPSVSLSGGSTHEIGSTVSDVALSWSCNKVMTTRDLSVPVPIEDRVLGPGQNGSYNHIGAGLTSNTTYSISVSDGTNSTSSSTSIVFYNERYYGTTADVGPLDNSTVLAFAAEFATSRSNTHSYDCGGKYIWICYPASLGTATFVVGGLETTFDLTIQNVTNASGYLESFNCYRSHELQMGSGIVVVVS